MTKKLFSWAVLGLSLLGVNGLLAATPSSTSSINPSHTFNGLRIGAEGMIVQSESKIKSWENNGSWGASDNISVSGWNMAGGIKADVGRIFKEVYVGFNLEWAKGMGAHSAKCSETSGTGTAYKIQQRYVMAGSLKVGGLWQDCLLYYAKLGITKSEWDVRAFYSNKHFRNEKPLWGILMGAGVEHVLTNRWTVGIELDHQRYQTMTFHDATGDYRWKINPASNRILLNLNYKLF